MIRVLYTKLSEIGHFGGATVWETVCSILEVLRQWDKGKDEESAQKITSGIQGLYGRFFYIPAGASFFTNLENLKFKVSGFHQVALRSSLDGLRLKELKEYSDSYSAPDYLRPVLGSKCLVMQTIGNYLGLGPSEETSESMFQVATRTFNLFLLCYLLVSLL
jgi:hypothetical protein